MLRILRDITGATHIDLDTRSRTITMRDTPNISPLPASFIQQLGKGPAAKSCWRSRSSKSTATKARDLGITPPASEQLIV